MHLAEHVPAHAAPFPIVSILTVVFNAAQELPPLIASVAALKQPGVEYIVIDGGSTDGTRELLESYRSVIDYTVSEPDGGIYDAMNKAVAAANGTFLLHLNAGDCLLHLPLAELATADAAGIDIAAFRVQMDDGSEFKPGYGARLRFRNTLHHQGTFYRRTRFPAYNIGYRVFADFDVNQRLMRNRARVALYDTVVASHMSGGISDINTPATAREFFQVIRGNYGRSHLLPAWLACKSHGLTTRLRSQRSLTARCLSVLSRPKFCKNGACSARATFAAEQHDALESENRESIEPC